MKTHETRIREVPGSNPGADQPDWGFFRGIPQSPRQMMGSIFITTIHLTIIHLIHIGYHKIKSVNLTVKILTTQQKKYIPSGTPKDTRRDMTEDVEASLNNNE